MKTSTSYYLRYRQADKSIGISFTDCKTLKSLEKEVKKFIDNKKSFEVWVKFNFENKPKELGWYGFDNYASFEVWWYDSENNEAGTYSLRENIYHKKLKYYERRLRKLMLRYGLQ